MKQTKTIILSLIVLLLGAGTVPAVETPVAVIDLSRVFDGYYKRRQADAYIKDEAARLEKERKEMVDNLNKEAEIRQKLLERASDLALSEAERDKSQQEAGEKALALKEMEQSIATFERSARTKLLEQQRRRRNAILEDIRALVSAKAKASGYAHVVDTAAVSRNETPIFLYTNGEHDLTESVVKELNATAPPGVIKALDERDKGQKGEKSEASETVPSDSSAPAVRP